MRVLALCPHCQTQYDVSGREPGTQITCRCGAAVTVPGADCAQDRKVERCASCGGARAGEAPSCAYCGARFTSVDIGWGLLCPKCFCRLPNDAHFCVSCGLALAPEALDEVHPELPCPRCKVALQARSVEAVTVYECGTCGGLWVPTRTFEAICVTREKLGTARLVVGLPLRPHPAGQTDSWPVAYIPCPQCRELMNRRNFATTSGVIIDLCKSHGVWLDYQELNRIIQFIEGGGLENAVELANEAERKKKREAARNLGGPRETFSETVWMRMPPPLRIKRSLSVQILEGIADLLSGE